MNSGARVALLAGFLFAYGKSHAREVGRIEWKNVAPAYQSFQQIQPVLLNGSDGPIFLGRMYPDQYAQLERYNQATGIWEMGGWSIRCGVVANATRPIKISGHTERKINVYWQLSTDDWDRPQHFVVESTGERRPIKGRYKFVLRYALQPWTLIHHPDRIYIIESPEFELVP